MGFPQAISSLECDARPRPRFLMVTKIVPTSENLIDNIYEILFATCLASDSEMMEQGMVTFPVIINLFLSFYFGAERSKKKGGNRLNRH